MSTKTRIEILVGESKVDDVNAAFICSCAHKEIFGLKVAMDITFVMNILKV